MYTERLENNTRFETGRAYYYHFSCNYDSLSYMQIVSVSDTRKTAVIQKLIGGKPYGKPTRKKIHVWGGVEHISAGNYSMAGSWSADEWDKSELLKALDIDFMHEHERAEALEALPEMPAAAPADTVYTVNVNFCGKDYNRYGETVRGVSLADMVKYISDNVDAITDLLGEGWRIDYTLYKNGEFFDNSTTSPYGDILREISNSTPDEYPAILAAISDPDNDPDPAEPTDKPDYSEFDANFDCANIISVSFGGASCSASAPVKRKKLTEKEWKKQLEAKAAFEAAEKAAARAEIERRFNSLKIGERLSDNSIITDIETDEDGSIAYIYTKATFADWAVYDVEDFWDGVISFEEIPEPEQIDENQITFDELTAEADPADNTANYADISYKSSFKSVCINMLERLQSGKYHGRETENGLKMAIEYLDSIEAGKLSETKLKHVERLTAYRGTITDYRNFKTVPNENCTLADKSGTETPAPSPIDETAAKRGHEAYSFSDYKTGSATAEYNATVADVRAAADEVRGRIPEEYHGELDRLVNRYAAKLADWTNRKNRVDASCPSWFITGAANYPHKKHEKQMQRLDKLFKEYDSITALENRIKNFAYECKHRPIKAGDASAAEKLRAKVEELTALQNQMKQCNAEARKRGETAPYAAWALSNNCQNLKRYADRLAALEKAKADPMTQAEELGGEGFRVVRNTEIMRLQFLFDGKPDEQTRTLLKSNGFKWAPSQMAWQRQLTANAERAARAVAKAIQ